MTNERQSQDYPQSVIVETEAMIARSNAIRAAGGTAFIDAVRQEHVEDIDGTFTGTDNLITRHAKLSLDDEVVEPTVAREDVELPPHTLIDAEAEEDEAYGLKSSNAALQHRLNAETRETGLREIKKIREQYFDNKNE